MTRKTAILSFFTTILFCFSLHLPAFAAEADERFEKLGERYLDEFPALKPVYATWLGDHRFDGQLDQIDEKTRAKSLKFYREMLVELEKIPVEKLSRQNRIDHAMLKHEVQSQIFQLVELKAWESDPLIYTALTGGAIYNLLARDYAPLETRFSALADRLEQFPRLMKQIRETLKPEKVSPVQAEAVVKQNRGVLSILEHQVKPQLGNVSPALKTRLEKAMQTANEAVEEHQDWLESELVPKAKADFRLGAELYDKKLFFSLGTPLSREQIRVHVNEMIRKTRDEMYDISKTVYKNEYPGTVFPEQVDEFYRQAIIRAALEIAYRAMPEREKVVETAVKSLQESTDFVRKHDLLTLPPDPVEVIIMPEFQQGVSVAYCDSPGALDVGQKTFYAVSPIPKEWTEEQVRSYLREYNIRSIHELTIHEAMPGHYVQLALSSRFPGKLRSVLASETFIEGWAIYSEKMMCENGYMNDDPLMKLINLKWDLRVMTNAIIDPEIHAGTMTREEAMQLMMETGFQEEREAAMKWTRALLTSTQLSTYFVGSMEVQAIRKEVQHKLGERFDLKKYHDRLLSYGSPFPQLVKELMMEEE